MENENEEFQNLYEFIKKEKIHSVISNKEKLCSINLKFKLNEKDIRLCLYLIAIDSKDSNSIDNLNKIYLSDDKNNENKEEENDIFNIMYERELLDHQRLKRLFFMSLMDNFQFKISLKLFNSIIENEDIKSIKIILNNIYYDNVFIISMLFAYKNKINFTDTQLKNTCHKEINRIGLNQLTGDQKYKALKFAFENEYEDLVKILMINDITINCEKK